MLNVIDFLERFGQDAGLRYATGDVVAEALQQAGIDPAVRLAIVSKDQAALERLLGADTNVCCMINKPDDEEEEEEEDDEDEDEDDEDFDEDDEDEDEDDEDEDEEEDDVENVNAGQPVTDRAA